MNFKQVIKKLQESGEFSDFKKKNKDAFLCAAFFVFDFDTNRNIFQIDFYMPDKNMAAAFSIDKEIIITEEKILKKPDEIKIKIKFDVDKAIEMAKKAADDKIIKIIAVMQKVEEKQIWNLTCFLKNLAILKFHVDSMSGEIIKQEKGSIFDFVRK